MISKSYLMGLGGAVILLAGLSLYNSLELSMQYEPVQAEVDSVEKDCFIAGYRKKIVHTDTNELAYMECDLAPIVASQHGMSKSNIKVRYRIEYTYQYPANGAWYDGKYTDKVSYVAVEEEGEDPWYEGKVFKVYVHKKNPEKSRVVKGDTEFDEGSS